jgi:hypothetical protein
MKINIQFWSYLAQLFLEWEMLQTKVEGKIKTHISCSITFFPENRAVYEIMWKNIVQRSRQQMIIRRMRIAWPITKATHTPSRTHAHSECVITNAFALQQWLHEHDWVVRCMYIASIVTSTKHTEMKWTVHNPLTTQKQNSKLLCQQMHFLLKHKMLHLTLKISLYMASTCFGPFGPSSGSLCRTLLKLQSL